MTPKNTNRPSRARRFAAAAGVVVALDGAPALAQQPPSAGDVWAYYAELNPKGSFTFKLDGKEYTKSVGALRWNVSTDRLTAAGLDRTFTAFCAEPLVGVTTGNTYRFDVQKPKDPVAYGLPEADAAAVKQAELRSDYIHELFGRHYRAALDFSKPDNALAFQVALWELAHERQLPQGDPLVNRFSLDTGTFHSFYPADAGTPAPSFVSVAEDMLKSLTRDVTVFETSLPNMELVRMNGLPNAAAVIAQDQYALRGAQAEPGAAAAPGGAGGVGAGGPTGGLGGSTIGGSGFGAPVVGGGGSGGGAGGGSGGGFVSSPPGSSIQSPPTTPPTSTAPPPPFSPPPINSPPPPPPPQNPPPPGSPPPPDSPPPTTNNPPPNPVPAPAGLLLGGIAALALAGRRALLRAKK